MLDRALPTRNIEIGNRQLKQDKLAMAGILQEHRTHICCIRPGCDLRT